MTRDISIESLQSLRPFDRLNDEDMAEVLRGVEINHYASGDVVLDRFEAPSALSIVADGLVEELDSAGVVARFNSGDFFDYKAIVDGRSEHRFVARQDSVCFSLPVPILNAIQRRDASFRDFFKGALARQIDGLISVQQQREVASFLLSRIGDADLHPPLFVERSASLKSVAEIMSENGTSYVLVRDDERVGIFTNRDIRERSLLMGLPDETPVGTLASYDLVTLDRDDFLINALVIMTQRAIRHVVITHNGDVIGVFEQSDLLGHLSQSSYAIASRVDRAASTEDLAEAGQSIPELIRTMTDRGVKTRYISRMVTDLNRKIFLRLFEQLVPAEIRAQSCLMVMGSEGRAEQLLRTDQDNAIVFRQEPDRTLVDGPLKAFSEALSQLGYPPCPGGVMVNNRQWAKSLYGFKTDISRWLLEPSNEGFLDLAIFVDASPVGGDETLFDELRAHMFRTVRDYSVPVAHFAKAILSFDTPVGLFGRFVTERGGDHAGQLDLKKGGIFPIVHGIRSLALEYRLRETNTVARLRALSGQPLFDETFTADLIEAFDLMCMLRLRAQLEKIDRGLAPDNYVDPHKLSKLERELLRESLKLVSQFKADIGYHFKLNLVT